MHDVEARDARIHDLEQLEIKLREELQAKRQRVVAVEKTLSERGPMRHWWRSKYCCCAANSMHAGGDVRPRSIRWEWGRVRCRAFSRRWNARRRQQQSSRYPRSNSQSIGKTSRLPRKRRPLARLLAKEAMDKVGVKDEEAARARDEVERARMELESAREKTLRANTQAKQVWDDFAQAQRDFDVAKAQADQEVQEANARAQQMKEDMDHQNKLALREAEEAMEESRRMRLQSEEEHRQAQAKMDHAIKVKALEQGQSPESAKALAAEQANVQLRREFAALQTAESVSSRAATVCARALKPASSYLNCSTSSWSRFPLARHRHFDAMR